MVESTRFAEPLRSRPVPASSRRTPESSSPASVLPVRTELELDASSGRRPCAGVEVVTGERIARVERPSRVIESDGLCVRIRRAGRASGVGRARSQTSATDAVVCIWTPPQPSTGQRPWPAPAGSDRIAGRRDAYCPRCTQGRRPSSRAQEVRAAAAAASATGCPTDAPGHPVSGVVATATVRPSGLTASRRSDRRLRPGPDRPACPPAVARCRRRRAKRGVAGPASGRAVRRSGRRARRWTHHPATGSTRPAPDGCRSQRAGCCGSPASRPAGRGDREQHRLVDVGGDQCARPLDARQRRSPTPAAAWLLSSATPLVHGDAAGDQREDSRRGAGERHPQPTDQPRLCLARSARPAPPARASCRPASRKSRSTGVRSGRGPSATRAPGSRAPR